MDEISRSMPKNVSSSKLLHLLQKMTRVNARTLHPGLQQLPPCCRHPILLQHPPRCQGKEIWCCMDIRVIVSTSNVLEFCRCLITNNKFAFFVCSTTFISPLVSKCISNDTADSGTNARSYVCTNCRTNCFTDPITNGCSIRSTNGKQRAM